MKGVEDKQKINLFEYIKPPYCTSYHRNLFFSQKVSFAHCNDHDVHLDNLITQVCKAQEGYWKRT